MHNTLCMSDYGVYSSLSSSVRLAGKYELKKM